MIKQTNILNKYMKKKTDSYIYIYLDISSIGRHKFLINVGACFPNSTDWRVDTAAASDLEQEKYQTSKIAINGNDYVYTN